jgi:hypothetical protein
MDLLFGALFVLGAFVARKTVNDSMGQSFSVIGSSTAGIVGYLIMANTVDILKFNFGVGLLCWLAGGFLVANFIGDGDTNG